MNKNEKYQKIAEEVLQGVGGRENIKLVTHCMTRLRFDLKDASIPKEEKIKKIDIFQRQNKIIIKRDKLIVFLNQVCNFKDLLDKDIDIKNKIIDYIKRKIDEEFENNNDNYLNKLYKYDERFRDGIDYINNMIRSHVDESDLQTNKLMLEILENWSSKWTTKMKEENKKE